MTRLVRCLLVLAALVLGVTPSASHGAHQRMGGVHCLTMPADAGAGPIVASGAHGMHAVAEGGTADGVPAGTGAVQHCLCLLAATLPDPGIADPDRPPRMSFERPIAGVLSGLPLGPEPPRPRRPA